MNDNHILQILFGADPIVKITLLILLGFSIASWAVIFYKHRELKRFKTSSLRFSDAFWRTNNLEDLLTKYSGPENPLANIFRLGVADLLKRSKSSDFKRSGAVSVEGIRRKIERAMDGEVEKLERYLPFLATTGSTSPFIGLFGTVWGILGAFWQIGRAGSTSLAVVGPFIAESLIATAVGLAAAKIGRAHV